MADSRQTVPLAPRPRVAVRTAEFERWSEGLNAELRGKVRSVIDHIVRVGPPPGRPHVVLEAEERIAHARYARGVDNETVQAALDAIDENMSEAERRDDLYLSALKYFVEALAGRLEVRAVFEDDAVVV